MDCEDFLSWAICIREEDLLAQEEEYRRLKVRHMIVRNKNSDFQRNISQRNSRIEYLEKECRDLRKRLSEVGDGVTEHKAVLKNKNEEIKSLKSQLTSLDFMTADTSRLVAEKLALSRELAILKPEVHHLQSQVSRDQNILAEKLELERQVRALKVELESERKAARQVLKIIIGKYANLQSQSEALRIELVKGKREEIEIKREIESNYQAQLENLQKELTHEKQQREKLVKEAQSEAHHRVNDLRQGILREKENAEKSLEDVSQDLKLSETRRSTLEKKVEELWENLVSTKDQLKSCELELNQTQKKLVKQNSVSTRELPQTKNAHKDDNQKKENYAATSPLGGGATRGPRTYKKRGEFEQASVGEKSLFSITPFLNRTASIEADLLSIDADHCKDLDAKKKVVSDLENHSLPVASSKSRGRKRATKGKSEPKVTQPKISEQQGEIQSELRKAISPPENLIKLIAAEIDKDDCSEDLINSNPADSTLNSDRITTTEIRSEPLAKEKPPKKKRKLVRVAKVASVGDDEIAPELSSNLGIRSTRLLREGLKSNLPEGCGEAPPLFSPLKRDRRSAGKKS